MYCFNCDKIVDINEDSDAIYCGCCGIMLEEK